MEKMIRAMLWWEEAKQVFRNQKGQGMVEYGLILALVAVVAVAGLTLMGGNLQSIFDSTANKIKAAPAAG